jgi:hypothetical protein
MKRYLVFVIFTFPEGGDLSHFKTVDTHEEAVAFVNDNAFRYSLYENYITIIFDTITQTYQLSFN